MMHRQSGLSLVELMIALTVGSMITAGVVQLFSANSEAYQMLQGQSRIQESARFALEYMRRDIENAGRKGCNSNLEPDDPKLYYNQVDSTTLPYEYNIRNALQGYEGSASGWNPSLNDLPKTAGATNTNVFINGTGIDTDQIVPNTDVLVLRGIRRSDLSNFLEVSMTESDDEELFVVRPADGVDGLGFGNNELVLLHDCDKATVFQVTDITDADPIAIEHEVGLNNWSNATSTLSFSGLFETDASISALVTTIYYIAPGIGENNNGDTPLSLWRKEGISPPVELVEGVEDLQVLYGLGTTFPEQYVNANQVPSDQWERVKTVRVAIVTNTIDDIGGAMQPTHGCLVQTCIADEPADGIDGLQRRSFSRTVARRN